MKVKLAENEKLIKNWTYAKGKDENGEKEERNIMVTSNRLIVSSNSNNFVDYKEVDIHNITSIKVVNKIDKIKKNSKLFIILAILCGISTLFFLASTVAGFGGVQVAFFIIAFLICIVLTIVFALCSIKYAKYEKRGQFTLVVNTVPDQETINIIELDNASKFEISYNSFEVEIDVDVAQEVAENLGAIILNQKLGIQPTEQKVEIAENDSNKEKTDIKD